MCYFFIFFDIFDRGVGRYPTFGSMVGFESVFKSLSNGVVSFDLTSRIHTVFSILPLKYVVFASKFLVSVSQRALNWSGVILHEYPLFSRQKPKSVTRSEILGRLGNHDVLSLPPPPPQFPSCPHGISPCWDMREKWYSLLLLILLSFYIYYDLNNLSTIFL